MWRPYRREDAVVELVKTVRERCAVIVLKINEGDVASRAVMSEIELLGDANKEINALFDCALLRAANRSEYAPLETLLKHAGQKDTQLNRLEGDQCQMPNTGEIMEASKHKTSEYVGGCGMKYPEQSVQMVCVEEYPQEAIAPCRGHSLVNKTVLDSGFTSLHVAVMNRDSSLVAVLLASGANPDVPCPAAFLPGNHLYTQHYTDSDVTALWMAVALGDTEIARLLVGRGAAIRSAHWPGYRTRVSPWELSHGDQEMYHVLHADGCHSVPIQHACLAFYGRNKRLAEFCTRPRVTRWTAGILEDLDTPSPIRRKDNLQEILRVPTYNVDEELLKIMFVQSMFLSCLLPGSYGTSVPFVESLMDHGACLAGLDHCNARELHTACVSLMNDAFEMEAGCSVRRQLGMLKVIWNFTPAWFICDTCLTRVMEDRNADLHKPPLLLSEFSLPSILPVVVRFCASAGTYYDVILQLLLRRTQKPWQLPLEDIPFSEGRLHDGPTCDHAALSDNQKRVSLRQCTQQHHGGMLPNSLMSMARNTILVALRSSRSNLRSIQELPLPAILQAYLCT